LVLILAGLFGIETSDHGDENHTRHRFGGFRVKRGSRLTHFHIQHTRLGIILISVLVPACNGYWQVRGDPATSGASRHP
jgi:hypothetical protein